MAKIKSKWVCQNCGYETSKYLGKCPDCGSWGTITEEFELTVPKNIVSNSELRDSKPSLIDEIDEQKPDILCIQELSPVIFKHIQSSLDSVFGYTDSMTIKKQPLRYRI